MLFFSIFFTSKRAVRVNIVSWNNIFLKYLYLFDLCVSDIFVFYLLLDWTKLSSDLIIKSTVKTLQLASYVVLKKNNMKKSLLVLLCLSLCVFLCYCLYKKKKKNHIYSKDKVQCAFFWIGYLQHNNLVIYQYAVEQGENVIVKGMMMIQLVLWT